MIIERGVLERIFKSCETGYPYEVAGLMLSNSGGRVVEILPVSNVHEDDRRVRYRVDPMEYYRAEKKAEELGLQVVGVFHSHPDHPAQPSRYDLEHALPGWFYLIVSVYGGRVSGYACWLAVENSGGKRFVQEVVSAE
ncbi:MAG: M67 family metallopeptidase [Candidatus Caldarchaeum sp.]|nr:M67 family metallopeptidase [Candidatus Caldarchaeum sp.]